MVPQIFLMGLPLLIRWDLSGHCRFNTKEHIFFQKVIAEQAPNFIPSDLLSDRSLRAPDGTANHREQAKHWQAYCAEKRAA